MALRLSHKILAIAALGMVSLCTLGAIYIGSESLQGRYRQQSDAARGLSDLETKASVALLEARRLEKDFLLRKDEKYVQQHATLSATLDGLLTRIRQADLSAEMAARVDALRANVDAYKTQFKTLAEARIGLGLSEELGIEGRLRGAVHAIETALKEIDQSKLTITMLMMRRHEKDFMLRGDDKSVAQMKTRAAEFGEQLKASELASAIKSNLADRLSVYQREFTAFVDGARRVAAEQKQVSATYASIEPEVAALDQWVKAAAADAEASRTSVRRTAGMVMNTSIGVIALVLGMLGFLISRAVSRPLATMVTTMTRLASGDTAFAIPGLNRRDEIGEMAGAVATFRDTMIETERLRVEAARTETDTAAQRRIDMDRLATEFESAVGEIVSTVSDASQELEGSASTLSRSTEQAQQIAATVSAASGEASANLHSVAAATEELTASVAEISRQVQDAAEMANDAVTQAQLTNERVGLLSQAANRIGAVVELINTIAGQTNLLALNATIEAARAGDAGKGFAVVASEVKALAEQTAKATGDISQQVADIQAATGDSVTAIGEISSTINKLSEIASTIASAVEEQGAATSEIARNIQQASVGTSEVATNIVMVERSASDNGVASAQVLASARGLSQGSVQLKYEVERFLETVRAA
jgi:methyl-accepting chemotaxis protein